MCYKENNPGPGSSFHCPCGVCSKTVADNQSGIFCESCFVWFHTGCIGMSLIEYDRLSNSTEGWCCNGCFEEALPFHHCSDIFTGSSTSSSTGTSFMTPATSTKSVLSSLSTNLQCCLCNARGIVNKSLDLKLMIECENLDIIAVTETFLSDEILNTEIVNGDYSVFGRDRNRHSGGILLLVKSSIPAVRRHDLETTCELLWVEIHKTLFGVFYISTP